MRRSSKFESWAPSTRLELLEISPTHYMLHIIVVLAAIQKQIMWLT